jgi:hypothetical protein
MSDNINPTFKSNRSYVLKVEASDAAIGDINVEIANPFTCEFNITRNNLASANTANFTIYNLAPLTRDRIFKDVYDIGNIKAIQFFAGYSERQGTLLPMCFNGNIKRAYSHRVGPDFKTVIEAFDGQQAMANSHVSLTIPAGMTQEQQIQKIAGSMDGFSNDPKKKVTTGDKFTDMSKKAAAIMGNPMDLLNQICQGQFYIDSGNAYALGSNEVVAGEIRLISAANGLLATPRKMETLVEIEMLFEPRIKPSQLIELDSMTDRRFNGVYKITGITHSGVISGAVGGEARTRLQMMNLKGYTVIQDKATQQYRAVAP